LLGDGPKRLLALLGLVAFGMVPATLLFSATWDRRVLRQAAAPR
jgi:uncharacterized membrane protein YesL